MIMTRDADRLFSQLSALAGLLCMNPALAAASNLADAVMERDRTAVRALLEEGAAVDSALVDGATALHWAAYHDDVETARLLLAAGADPAASNRAGATPDRKSVV